MGWLRDGFQQIWGSWVGTYHDPMISLGLGDSGVRVAAWGARDLGCQDYPEVYRTQPFVRTCIDFIARNIAQLPIHVYHREEDDSRIRLRDHGLAELLAAPNPIETQYRFINATVTDLCLYGYALWGKVRQARGGLQLARINPALVRPVWVGVEGDEIPGIQWPIARGELASAAMRDLVHFKLYDPDPRSLGLSPLASLCDLLAVERACAGYQRYYFTNGARHAGVIERPLDAPRWTPEARKKFVEDYHATFGGAQAAGRTVVLEDGMTYKATSYSVGDSQLVELHKLQREEIAALYHIPAPMVGILEHATFSNIKEQHNMLYQDCLGPTLRLIEQEINRALVSEYPRPEGVYVEFEVGAKLRGNVEDQSLATRTLTGAPIMAINEMRAKYNLPRLEDPIYDLPMIPLNLGAGDVSDAREIAKLEATQGE
jgi:HK97 family phage portal protein